MTVDKKDYSSLRVLVVDDKAFIRSIVQGMLLRLKVKAVMQAAHGQQALKLLRKYTYRMGCIISDWNMDPVGGLELLRAVRAGEIPELPRETCFIMLTGHAHEAVVKAAVALDVHAYLVKPVSFEKLIKTLETALAREIQLKSPEDYMAVTGVEIPPAVKAAENHIPPWVTWITKSPRRIQMEERIKQIRKEVADALSNPAYDAGGAAEEKDIEIHNMRRLPIDEIQVGAILAENIYGNDRALLIATGTALSKGLIARLKDLASEGGEEVKLWVGDSAASPTQQ
jgi:two-component system chemotaxis response regulator CheY